MDSRLQLAYFKGIPQIGTFVQMLLWNIVHLMIGVWYAAVGIVRVVESYLISQGWLKKYENLNICKVKHLGIVVESEDARRTFEVIELLMWLRELGVTQVCLYDVEGVLKRSKDVIMDRLGNASLFEVPDAVESDSQCSEKHMTLEFASVTDGKDAVAKATNVLLQKLKSEKVDNVQEIVFTEQDMFDALKSIGYGGPDPDLLLVYAPARCHLGFPAWRLRYTEIVRMNTLKSKQYGSLIKAIYKFTIVRQNYGRCFKSLHYDYILTAS